MTLTLEARTQQLLTLPEREVLTRGILKTEKGIPYTLAEYYGTSQNKKDIRDPLLYIFAEKEMDNIQAQNNGRYNESFRFNSKSPIEIKDELLEELNHQDIYLFFSVISQNVFRATLRDEPLDNILTILGSLQEKYS